MQALTANTITLNLYAKSLELYDLYMRVFYQNSRDAAQNELNCFYFTFFFAYILPLLSSLPYW